MLTAGSCWATALLKDSFQEGKKNREEKQKSINHIRDMQLPSFHSQILPFKCSSSASGSARAALLIVIYYP